MSDIDRLRIDLLTAALAANGSSAPESLKRRLTVALSELGAAHGARAGLIAYVTRGKAALVAWRRFLAGGAPDSGITYRPASGAADGEVE